MIRQEITLQLPPARLQDNGDILARAFPLMLAGTPEAWQINVEDIYIAPSTGVVEVQMSGPGVAAERRHTIGAVQTALPQAWASQMAPLHITLSNLNPDSMVHVVIVLNVVETLGGRGNAYGGGVRFQGAYPLGTDGSATTDAGAGTAGTTVRMADGHWFHAFLTVDAHYTLRNIRDITGQVRVLAPTGTGTIPTGGTIVAIIVKKGGVTLEASTTTLDIPNWLDPSAPGGGAVEIGNIAAGTILEAMLASDSVTTGKIKDGNVTPAKLSIPVNLDARHVGLTTNLGTGATLGTITYTALAAGTYQLFAIATIGGQATGSDCLGWSVIVVGGNDLTSNYVRWNTSQESIPVMGATSVSHGGGDLVISCRFDRDSGGTFTSRFGQLLTALVRTA